MMQTPTIVDPATLEWLRVGIYASLSRRGLTWVRVLDISVRAHEQEAGLVKEAGTQYEVFWDAPNDRAGAYGVVYFAQKAAAISQDVIVARLSSTLFNTRQGNA